MNCAYRVEISKFALFTHKEGTPMFHIDFPCPKVYALEIIWLFKT